MSTSSAGWATTAFLDFLLEAAADIAITRDDMQCGSGEKGAAAEAAASVGWVRGECVRVCDAECGIRLKREREQQMYE